jgi:hypothetical protein
VALHSLSLRATRDTSHLSTFFPGEIINVITTDFKTNWETFYVWEASCQAEILFPWKKRITYFGGQ